MACNNPSNAYYAAAPNKSGKHSLTFNRKFRYEGSDLTLSQPLVVPCGKCLGCRADQSLMWSIRAYQESTLHEQNSFLTLTYSDENLPSDGKIKVKHLQDFFKRLRKITPQKLRYIACGEYGEKTHRPHYHAIIFGKDWLENSLPVSDDLYANPLVTETWGYGHCTLSPVNMATICYVCGYVTKKVGQQDTFSLMSRRPGIGHNWLSKFKDDIIRNGKCVIEGREYPVPKRYLIWEEEDFQQLKKERTAYAKMKSKKDDLYQRANAQRSREQNIKANLKRKDETL